MSRASRLRMLGLGVLAGCLDAPVGIAPPPAPVIDAAVVAANPHNVLSAVVTVTARNADSVAVQMHPTEDDSITPAMTLVADAASIPVLGLRPEKGYVLRPIAYGPGGIVLGGELELITGSLPTDLPSYTASGLDPSPGYVVFAAGTYGIVIDNTGRVVWYHRFPSAAGLSFMAQPSGHYVARPPTPAVGDAEPWVEIDPLGTVTRALPCARGLQSRLHDLIGQPDGSYWLMCDETRTMDLTAAGGVPAARVTGTVVQHVGEDGSLLFEWNPFDHFAISDLDPAERTGVNVNWTHGNSIDLAPDGDLLISFRSLGEVTKIDTETGTVIWRLGGLRNEFSFLATPAPAFAHQHSVRSCAAGELAILDNLGTPGESRAERYVIDDASRTARLVQSYASVPGVVTQIGGSVQPLPGGRTLVSFGTEGRVEEYDADGRMTWHIEGDAGYVFRAQRIRSLYHPGVGTTR